jgi:hypothetical protein
VALESPDPLAIVVRVPPEVTADDDADHAPAPDAGEDDHAELPTVQPRVAVLDVVLALALFVFAGSRLRRPVDPRTTRG